MLQTLLQLRVSSSRYESVTLKMTNTERLLFIACRSLTMTSVSAELPRNPRRIVPTARESCFTCGVRLYDDVRAVVRRRNPRANPLQQRKRTGRLFYVADALFHASIRIPQYAGDAYYLHFLCMLLANGTSSGVPSLLGCKRRCCGR